MQNATLALGRAQLRERQVAAKAAAKAASKTASTRIAEAEEMTDGGRSYPEGSPNMRTAISKSAILVLTILLATLSPANASCGPGKHPDYSDIRGVRYARTSCFGKCPDYEVLFSDLGAYYAGRRWVEMTGTYESETVTNSEYLSGTIPKSLRSAIIVLRRHKFFSLNRAPDLVTDVPHFIIAVERCDVTTKLDVPAYDLEAEFVRLFQELDAITDRMHWRKTSDRDDSPLSGYASIFP